jgi:hypothetical protein
MNARKIGPVYGVWDGELMIDAPVREVWRHVLNYPSWQNFPVARHISGRPGEEGEVVMLRKDEKGFEFPPYYAITVKLEPERRVIWKTYPEKGADDFFGIVEFGVADAGGKTRFGYHLVYEFNVPYSDESELVAYRKGQEQNFTTLFGVIFPKLKQLAEEGAKRPKGSGP